VQSEKVIYTKDVARYVVRRVGTLASKTPVATLVCRDRKGKGGYCGLFSGHIDARGTSVRGGYLRGQWREPITLLLPLLRRPC
jgi:hypothetical protein